MKRGTWIWIGVGAVLAAGAIYWVAKPEKKGPDWRQAKVERGAIRQRISATGTLSGLVQVNVGSQISGTIAALYVDYNSTVKKGQPIAQIEPTLYQAAVTDAEGTRSKAEAALQDAQRQLQRSERLFKDKLIADQDLQTAQLVAAKAAGDLENAKASVARARANLGYCTIQAPVSGVVVSRSVDVGQTVAASFSTPTLFVIAQDLTKMKVEASVDEADIGQVKEGQPALFTVDSFPDTQFRGRVNQVRLEPITQQNVVTYKVVIQVDNSDLKLRPGMTADVSIQTQMREDVLKVPSAALRFNPRAFMNGGARPAGGPMGGGPAAGAGQGSNARAIPAKGLVARREDHVWILGPDGKPKSVTVQAGITDGQWTEVSGESLSEGMQVLVGVEEAKRAATPQPLGGPRR